MQLAELKARLFASNHKLTAVLAGGGSFFFPLLMEAGGASAILVRGEIPYGHTALHYVAAPWGRDQKAVSQRTVDNMTINTQKRSNWHEPHERENHVSLACSCALKTDNEREGREHRAWVSLRSEIYPDQSFYLHLDPTRTREEQERGLSTALLYLLSEYVGVLDDDINELLSSVGVNMTEETPMGYASP